MRGVVATNKTDCHPAFAAQAVAAIHMPSCLSVQHPVFIRRLSDP